MSKIVSNGESDSRAHGETTSPKIRLFNAKFSPNLGDGLLSECLEEGLIALGADKDTWSIDLAQRLAYGEEMAGRALIMSVLEKMPPLIRRNFVRIPLAIKSARNWRPRYATSLGGASAVVIGGGNLLSDMDLNFPTKLSLAVEEAEKWGLPIFIYGAGVAGNWSSRGEAMVKSAFSKPNVKGIFVRDLESKEQWDNRFGDATGHQAIIVRDPGLIAQQIYELPKTSEADLIEGRRPVFGLGIMSHVAIKYHSAHTPSPDYLEQWYIDVAREAIKQGFHLKVFTNGSPEDRAYAEDLYSRIRALGDETVLSFPTANNPKELCGIISELDVLIAYRMHAVIAAYSLGVPAIALAWDRKLSSFMKSVDREEWLQDVQAISAAESVALARKASEDGIPDQQRLKVLSDARDGVKQLYSSIAASLKN